MDAKLVFPFNSKKFLGFVKLGLNFRHKYTSWKYLVERCPLIYFFHSKTFSTVLNDNNTDNNTISVQRPGCPASSILPPISSKFLEICSHSGT